ncbi:uncharacterized protein LOC110748694, partial [Prunus avium]|uniref:Uncharacterized protein LOC110748694 n=1 Tax=Prunus avium TaxID=42229 RepID=A0A6P5RTG5_PRUAV
MDRSWMLIPNRLDKDYIAGVKSFIDAANKHLNSDNETRCPCRDCQNGRLFSLPVIWRHLITRGISQHYQTWTLHGESVDNESSTEMDDDSESDTEDDNDVDMFGILDDMIGPINMDANVEGGAANSSHANKFNDLFEEAKRELYPGCTTFSPLTFIIRLMHIKVLGRWSNKHFNMLLQFLKCSHPKGAIIPTSLYDAKKMLREVGLGYESIHACVYDCALFWKQNEKLDKCPECNESRYKPSNSKKKLIPQKVLRYFPLKSRLQRLYASRHTAIDMKWHKDKRLNEEGILRHPSDSEQWKDFDIQYPWFAHDSRNVRLGLATDGFNPFGNMSNNYSLWPVILIPYNLPPWKCMKANFSMMTLLIPGPNAPGRNIDVYLRPLVDELKELWEDGVQTFDVSTEASFRMHACVLWTINDFPAYGNLSGWSTKGYLACPVCNADITSDRLIHKICYMGHRRFLPRNHSWRKSLAYNGKTEHRPPPRLFSGDELLKQLDLVKHCKPGKHPANPDLVRKRKPQELNWTKKSIFFELKYWSKLKLRHNIDVMHVEKNICDNIIGTLLNIKGKTKDTDNARRDLKDMNIRPNDHLMPEGNGFRKPHARYTLNVNQRKDFCKFLKSVKFPDGYAANISRNVTISDGKISGLKSHDCHVLLQRLLPVGIRSYLDSDVCTALVELSIFFQRMCAKTLKISDLDQMEKDIVLTLCKLEKIFPPAFFDVMVHLAVHLPREAKLAGPVTYRWMYPIE